MNEPFNNLKISIQLPPSQTIIIQALQIQIPYSRKTLENKDCRKFSKVHLHRECYGNCENWQKNLAKCCNLPNSPKFFHRQCFLLYGMACPGTNETDGNSQLASCIVLQVEKEYKICDELEIAITLHVPFLLI